jgi:hypothetical protein
MEVTLPRDREVLLTRDQTAVALTAAGYPISSGTLNQLATRDAGPPYRRFGTNCYYPWGTSLDWAETRHSGARKGNAA